MGRLPITGIDVFVAVIRNGTMREAAKQIGIRPSAVSYQIKALEDRLGSKLFERTTRRLELTRAGQTLFEKSANALSELEVAFEDARVAGNSKKGTIRITLPKVAYDMAISSRIRTFYEAYPNINLELSFDESFVELAEKGFHAGIRLENHVNENMIVRRIYPAFKEVYFGAPRYFEKHGMPTHPNDLTSHNCIHYRLIASSRFANWCFNIDGRETMLKVKGNLIVNSTEAWMDAAEQGLGIAWMFDRAVADRIEAGRLQPILEDYALSRSGYFIYYPRNSPNIEALRLFIDFFRQ